jgi:hypothetical protein
MGPQEVAVGVELGHEAVADARGAGMKVAGADLRIALVLARDVDVAAQVQRDAPGGVVARAAHVPHPLQHTLGVVLGDEGVGAAQAR